MIYHGAGMQCFNFQSIVEACSFQQFARLQFLEAMRGSILYLCTSGRDQLVRLRGHFRKHPHQRAATTDLYDTVGRYGQQQRPDLCA